MEGTHTRFVAVAGVLRTGEEVDANLRKLQITRRVDCADVRACKTARLSILTAVSVRFSETEDGPRFPFRKPRGVADAPTRLRRQTRSFTVQASRWLRCGSPSLNPHKNMLG